MSIDQGHNGFERIHLAEIHCRLAHTELRQYSTQRGQLCRVYLNLAECVAEGRRQRHIVQALLQDRAPRTADSNTVQRRCELLEQPRLANARLAFDQRERELAPERRADERLERGQLRLTTQKQQPRRSRGAKLDLPAGTGKQCRYVVLSRIAASRERVSTLGSSPSSPTSTQRNLR